MAQWHADVRERALTRREYWPALTPRCVVYAAMAFAIGLHLGILIALREAMRPEFVADETAIQVVLIDASYPELPLPEPASRAIFRPMPGAPANISAPHKPQRRTPSLATPSPVTPTESIPTFRAYNIDGSLNIPADLAQQIDRAQPEPTFKSPPIEMSPIMRHQRPLKIRPNHFAQNWQPAPDETLLGKFTREHLTKQSEFVTPGGRTSPVVGWC